MLGILYCLKAPSRLHSEIGGATACCSTGTALSPGPCPRAGALPAAPALLEGLFLAPPPCPVPVPWLGEGGHGAGCVPFPAAQLLPCRPCLAAARDKNSPFGGVTLASPPGWVSSACAHCPGWVLQVHPCHELRWALQGSTGGSLPALGSLWRGGRWAGGAGCVGTGRCHWQVEASRV